MKLLASLLLPLLMINPNMDDLLLPDTEAGIFDFMLLQPQDNSTLHNFHFTYDPDDLAFQIEMFKPVKMCIPYRMSVYNIVGTEVIKRDGNDLIQESTQINAQNLPTGLYMFKLWALGQESTYKVLVNRRTTSSSSESSD